MNKMHPARLKTIWTLTTLLGIASASLAQTTFQKQLLSPGWEKLSSQLLEEGKPGMLNLAEACNSDRDLSPEMSLQILERISDVLKPMGRKGAELIASLFLTDDWNYAWILFKREDPVAIPVLIKTLPKLHGWSLTFALKDLNSLNRRLYNGKVSPEAQNALVALLGRPGPDGICVATSFVETDPEEAFRILSSTIRSKSVTTRVNTIRAIVHTADPEGAKLLVERLQDPSASVRRIAASDIYLVHVPYDYRPVVSRALQQTSKASDRELRKGAIASGAQLGFSWAKSR
ncbi:MAG TPA: hypothetical protein VGL56_10565 [Fimbriimonadaceae bacterium]|jgi:hypothetical protein